MMQDIEPVAPSIELISHQFLGSSHHPQDDGRHAVPHSPDVTHAGSTVSGEAVSVGNKGAKSTSDDVDRIAPAMNLDVQQSLGRGSTTHGQWNSQLQLW